MDKIWAALLWVCHIITFTRSDVFSSIDQLETLVNMETELLDCLKDPDAVRETIDQTDDKQRYENINV